jgi:hypothetical protein
MKKMLGHLTLFSMVWGGQLGFCNDEIYDDGHYATKEPMESPPIYVHNVPTYSYRMKCKEKEIPVRKLCCRPVQRFYELQRVKYVPQYYTETISRTEIEYYYVDSVDVRQNWTCERNCEFTPQYFRPTPCQGENSMTPYEPPPRTYPKPFGCKDCP